MAARIKPAAGGIRSKQGRKQSQDPHAGTEAPGA
jgi:hypothetical protein